MSISCLWGGRSSEPDEPPLDPPPIFGCLGHFTASC